MQVALNYVRNGAPNPSKPVLVLYRADLDVNVSVNKAFGTGVVPIFSRSPASMAQTAATIDEFAGGRMVLGIGVSHRVTVENWYGGKIEKPVTQMRESSSCLWKRTCVKNSRTPWSPKAA